ncbi:hypothetical protein GUJ93_ZPchr0034g18726 [Zizania palustris]|uniref:Pentatricopeptide repeat-containing protein n=1 Tax=Zizania palustris TaxID=103762 RepID=A0A8J5RE15_ZIZPA|nr:hypothetical protein GUJ93_ZPchr0034g18726 [Zizania palustris]
MPSVHSRLPSPTARAAAAAATAPSLRRLPPPDQGARLIPKLLVRQFIFENIGAQLRHTTLMHNRLQRGCFSSFSAAAAAIGVPVSNYGISAAKSRSRNQHGSNINNALKVLDLVPRKTDYGRVEGPIHQRLIHDCMDDILGVQSNHAMRKGNGVSYSCNNPAQVKHANYVSKNGSACSSRTGIIKDMFMLIVDLHRRGEISADQSTLASAMSSCAHRRSFTGGTQLHALSTKVGYDLNVFVGSSLITLYSRCGKLESSYLIFQSMPTKNTVSWTAMISGLLDEAWDLIQTMSTPPNAVIWGSLLASCRVHGKISIGIHAAEHRLKLEPGCAATHIQLANLYASIGCWSDVARVRMAMKERGLKTNTGCSWIEVGGKATATDLIPIWQMAEVEVQVQYCNILKPGTEMSDGKHSSRNSERRLGEQPPIPYAPSSPHHAHSLFFFRAQRIEKALDAKFIHRNPNNLIN